MSENTERSLADATEAPEEEAPEGVEVEPGQMTTGSVLSGARAMRRAVKIRPNLHVFADLERLIESIDEAPEGENVDDLIDEYDAAKAAFLEHQWWVVEQRTIERRTLVRRGAAKLLGYTLDEDLGRVEGDDEDRTRESEIEVHVLADHIVQPEGVTADDLTAFHASSPGEFTRFEHTVAVVQRTLSEEQSQDVVRDFSSRRSEATQRS